ncbi:MAG: hypothetical protein OEV94_05325 [Deltaproteobacteria bacterium]|nr:hypothetical protein [Deltaproteobacteria bacterium]
MSKTLPAGAYRFDFSAPYTHLTIPRSFLVFSSLPERVWAKVVVLAGDVDVVFQKGQRVKVTPAAEAVIAPGDMFQLAATGRAAQFYLEYFHEAKAADPATILAGLRSA